MIVLCKEKQMVYKYTLREVHWGEPHASLFNYDSVSESRSRDG